MHIVVNKPVKLIIGSKDVIHDVGFAQFRMKMDAVPGTPTTMWFTPKYTTKEMKEKTGNPDFVYEISCDQMCGKGHLGMRGVLIVETQEEFDQLDGFAKAAILCCIFLIKIQLSKDRFNQVNQHCNYRTIN